MTHFKKIIDFHYNSIRAEREIIDYTEKCTWGRDYFSDYYNLLMEKDRLNFIRSCKKNIKVNQELISILKLKSNENP